GGEHDEWHMDRVLVHPVEERLGVREIWRRRSIAPPADDEVVGVLALLEFSLCVLEAEGLLYDGPRVCFCQRLDAKPIVAGRRVVPEDTSRGLALGHQQSTQAAPRVGFRVNGLE